MSKALVSSLVGLIAAGPAVAAEFRPETIKLSSGGLAEIAGTVPVMGRTVIEFDAPLAQVDDILKSLVVQGRDLRILSVDLPGRERLGDTFAGMPLKPADLESSVTLLAALKGVRVEIRRSDRNLAGLVIGVEAVDGGQAQGRRARLALATDDDAIEHVEIDEATRVTIADDRMRGALKAALKAVAADRAADKRRIAVTVEAPAETRALVTYVVAAPVWKPTWRVVLPAGQASARFQGWAVLENRTGLDWKGVGLTLSSGTPVALRQNLYESVSVPRPESPLRVGQRLRPDMDRGVAAPRPVAPPSPLAGGVMAKKPAAFAGRAEMDARPALALAAPAPASMDFAEPPPVAGGVDVAAVETLAAATFALPGPVDLAVGRSLTLPFFDGAATATRVSVFQASVNDRHPIAAVRIKNDSAVTLPGGIVTVYEGAEATRSGVGFVGDAEFAGAAPGEERTMAYALDAKIGVASDVKDSRAMKTVKVENGVLIVEYGRQKRTVYALTGDPSGPRSLSIEHVANPGWTVTTDGNLVGRDGRRARIGADLGAGESRSVTVTETIVDRERWSILETPDAVVAEVVSSGDRIEPALREPLRRIAQVRRDTAEFERTIERVDEAIGRIREDQERVRGNLAAVDRNGELARTYQDRLKRQEAEMSRLEKERDAAQTGLQALRQDLARLVRQLGG